MKKPVFLLLLCCLILAAAFTTTGCAPRENSYHWRMATSWPGDSPFFTEAATAICERISELSGGRLTITPYPAGEITGALEVLTGVEQGSVEMGHSWAGYWLDSNPVFELFSSVPSQMTAQEWVVWLYGPARGIDLWTEFYAGYGIVPFPGGLMGPEFGFFTSKPIETLDDFNGLTLRASGLAAEVLQELGASTVLLAAADIKQAMIDGQIDGFEFSVPAVDWPMGFQDVAPYVSLPSWHQPSAMNETIVNKKAWESLPDDLKAIIEAACKEISLIDFYTQLEGSNASAFDRFIEHGTVITLLDDEASQTIAAITNQLLDEKSADDPFYQKVVDSHREFRDTYRAWETWDAIELFP